MTLVAAGHRIAIGPDSGGLLHVHSGMLKLVATRTGARQSILRLCLPGDVTPFRTGPADEGLAFAFVAITESTVTVMEGRQVGALLADTTSARKLLGAFAIEIRTSNARSTRQKLLECTNRAAATICYLAERLGRQSAEGVVVEHPLTQAELADLTGIARESFSRALNGFITRGWLLVDRGTLTVLDEPALRSHAGYASALSARGA